MEWRNDSAGQVRPTFYAPELVQAVDVVGTDPKTGFVVRVLHVERLLPSGGTVRLFVPSCTVIPDLQFPPPTIPSDRYPAAEAAALQLLKESVEIVGNRGPRGGPHFSSGRPPAFTVRFGNVRVVAYENRGPDGRPWFSFVPSRVFREGGREKTAQSLGLDDLLSMAEALRHAWVQAQNRKHGQHPQEPGDDQTAAAGDGVGAGQGG